jgi:hypothetical protein
MRKGRSTWWIVAWGTRNLEIGQELANRVPLILPGGVLLAADWTENRRTIVSDYLSV